MDTKLFEAPLITPLNEEIVEDHKCRICLESTNPEDLISPCLCKGGALYTHRRCLDAWRSRSHKSFYQCEICNFKYEFEQVEDTQNLANRRRTKYIVYVTLELLFALFTIHCIVLAIMGLVTLVDTNNAISADLHIASHPVAHYVLAWIIFLACIGLTGLIIGLSKDNSQPQCIFCWCPQGGGFDNSNNSGDFAGCCFLTALIILVILVVFGLVIGLWMFIGYAYEVQERRRSQIYLRIETAVYRVKDKPYVV